MGTRTSDAPRPSSPRPYSWWPLITLAATIALEHGDRQALSQAAEGIRAHFEVSDGLLGALPSASLLFGALVALPAGTMADRTRRTRLVAIATLVWTAGVLGAGLAPTFAILLGARLLLGVMEAGSPPSVALLADYYSVRERGKVMGLYQGGAVIGAMVGLFGGGVAVSLGGWRWALLLFAPLGVLVAIAVNRLPEPDRGDRDAEAFDEYATLYGRAEDPDADPPEPTSALAPASLREALAELRTIRTFWLALVAIGISQMLLTGIQFWGIPFFRRVHDLTPERAGAVAVVLGIGSAIGILTGGPLAQRLVDRGILAGRVYVVAFGAIFGSLTLTPAFASSSLALTMPLLALGGLFLALPIAPAEALLADVVRPGLRGRSGGIRSLVRGFSFSGSLLIGLLSSVLGDDLQRALTLFAPTYAVGGILTLLAARTYVRDHQAALAASRRSH